jgi:hypothetical protein
MVWGQEKGDCTRIQEGLQAGLVAPASKMPSKIQG